jgi:MSHA biogenesis protein MshM
MYLGHFALQEAPFSITPDTEFFFAHEGAQASLNTLLIALRSGEGFIKVVGELGCGKTVLCRQLLRLLQGEFVTAYIPNPDMGPDDLIMALIRELGIEIAPPISRHKVHEALRETLIAHASQGKRVLVCIDEAQAIPLRTIESLRLLSNLETEKRKLIQLVLLGQPDLDTTLERPEIRQLLQRISFSEYLGPMRADRVPAYLAHRLRCAACDDSTDTALFEPTAARLIAQYSRGTPRLINVLANKCLMLAFGEGVHRITPRHVHLCARDTPAIAPLPSWWRRWWPQRTAAPRVRRRGVEDSFGER